MDNSHLALDGEVVHWYAESDVAMQAVIQRYLRSGATADVYLAHTEFLSGSRLFAVKVYKEAEGAAKELAILQSVHRGTDVNPRAIPEAWEGHLKDIAAGKSVLVMEFLDPAQQWLALRRQKLLDDVTLLKQATQAAHVLDGAQREGYANADVKVENFYSVDDDRKNHRLVILDWNGCRLSGNKGGNELEFQATRRDSVRHLFKALYLAFTGQSLSQPLPPVASPTPDHWTKFPLLLRHAFQEAWSNKGLTEHEASMWFELAIWAQTGEWRQLLDWAEQEQIAANQRQLSEVVARLNVVLDALPEEAHLDPSLATQRQRLATWLARQGPESLAKATIENIVALIREGSFFDAYKQSVSEFQRWGIQNQRLQWELARWHAVAELGHNLTTKNVDLTPVSNAVVALFQTPSNPATTVSSNSGVIEDFSLLKKQIVQAEQLANEIIQTVSQPLHTAQIINQLKACETTIQTLQLPELTRRVLLDNLLPRGWNDWATHEIELANYARGQAWRLRLEQARKIFQQVLEFCSPGSFLQDISRTIEAQAEVIPDEPDLRLLKAAHDYATANKWSEALAIIENQREASLILRKYFQSLGEAARNWLENLASHVLYAPDLKEAELLLILGSKYHWPDMPTLSQRLTAARNAPKIFLPDTTILGECVRMRVEPWAVNEADPRQVATWQSWWQAKSQLEHAQRVQAEIKAQSENLKTQLDLYRQNGQQLEILFSSIREQHGLLQDSQQQAKALVGQSNLELSALHNTLKQLSIELVDLQSQVSNSQQQLKKLEEAKRQIEVCHADLQNINAIAAKISISLRTIAILSLLEEGKWSEARENILQLASAEKGEIAAENWQGGLQKVVADNNLQQGYKRWIEAMKSGHQGEMRKQANQLKHDISNPLYQYLLWRSFSKKSTTVTLPAWVSATLIMTILFALAGLVFATLAWIKPSPSVPLVALQVPPFVFLEGPSESFSITATITLPESFQSDDELWVNFQTADSTASFQPKSIKLSGTDAVQTLVQVKKAGTVFIQATITVNGEVRAVEGATIYVYPPASPTPSPTLSPTPRPSSTSTAAPTSSATPDLGLQPITSEPTSTVFPTKTPTTTPTMSPTMTSSATLTTSATYTPIATGTTPVTGTP